MEKFVPRGHLDPVYFDSSYYLFPDGPIAVEALRVIGAAMAEAGVVGHSRRRQMTKIAGNKPIANRKRQAIASGKKA